MITNRELAETLSGKSIEDLWQMANEVMGGVGPSGEIDSGLLRLVGACLAELAHRVPEIFDNPEIDEFLQLAEAELDGLPPCGHA